ncbi:MAG: RNA-protein complex protein Nop10 [Methanomassiliicoccaceae archaeon]|nr:RNA-protein complex protein Nop10 [Methanomassiliicoccaceae archaeon]
MRSSFRKCTSCGRYTLNDGCPSCGSATVSPVPVRFSPEDRYGDYRRKAVIEEYGENGKDHRHL